MDCVAPLQPQPRPRAHQHTRFKQELKKKGKSVSFPETGHEGREWEPSAAQRGMYTAVDTCTATGSGWIQRRCVWGVGRGEGTRSGWVGSARRSALPPPRMDTRVGTTGATRTRTAVRACMRMRAHGARRGCGGGSPAEQQPRALAVTLHGSEHQRRAPAAPHQRAAQHRRRSRTHTRAWKATCWHQSEREGGRAYRDACLLFLPCFSASKQCAHAHACSIVSQRRRRLPFANLHRSDDNRGRI